MRKGNARSAGAAHILRIGWLSLLLLGGALVAVGCTAPLTGADGGEPGSDAVARPEDGGGVDGGSATDAAPATDPADDTAGREDAGGEDASRDDAGRDTGREDAGDDATDSGPEACEPGAFLRCEGSVLVACSDDGQPTSQDCGEPGCNAGAGRCNECVAGSVVCDGDDRVSCGADGLATREACAFGCVAGETPRCAEFVPANGLGPHLERGIEAFAPTASVVLDTSAGTINGQPSWAFFVIAQSGAEAIGAFACTRIDIPAGVRVQVRGTRPVALISSSDVTIAGTLDLRPPGVTLTNGRERGGFGTGGPGSLPPPLQQQNGNCGADMLDTSLRAGGGGGGGGHGGAGGDGAPGTIGISTRGTPGNGGSASTARLLEPLVGGRSGGRGGCVRDLGATAAEGGGGGGAVQIVAAGTLRIPSGGIINAGGGGGQAAILNTFRAPLQRGGGGGGGSGGSVLLEAQRVIVEAGAIVAAHGGAGGASAPWSGSNEHGEAGRADATSQAAQGGISGAIETGGRGGTGAPAPTAPTALRARPAPPPTCAAAVVAVAAPGSSWCAARR